MRPKGFTLLETTVAVGLATLLIALTVPAARSVYKMTSLAASAANIRQLAAGAASYLGENNYRFWPYRVSGEHNGSKGTVWWFGFESSKSMMLPEGQRIIDMRQGPLAPYLPANLAPDPSFGLAGKPFKPKYRHGYIGVGYNVILAGNNGWMSSGGPPLRYWDLEKPGKTVVFATSAQINSFQKPASPSNPMIEEFYGFDDNMRMIPSVHFRHNGNAMAAYADGSAGLIPMNPSWQDKRAPDALVGRLPAELLR